LKKRSFYTAPADRKVAFSISGVIAKSIILLSFIILVAAATWYYGLTSLPMGIEVIGED
tara:strand:+ start:396 stop:572 length:177 start_codon:yes stop_codon:yes gene_type:complete